MKAFSRQCLPKSRGYQAADSVGFEPMIMQKWRRLGHVFCADGHTPWMFTHASYPTPVPQDDGTLRVFFSPRDQKSRSTIASLNLSLDGDKYEISRLSAEPLLSP